MVYKLIITVLRSVFCRITPFNSKDVESEVGNRIESDDLTVTSSKGLKSFKLQLKKSNVSKRFIALVYWRLGGEEILDKLSVKNREETMIIDYSTCLFKRKEDYTVSIGNKIVNILETKPHNNRDITDNFVIINNKDKIYSIFTKIKNYLLSSKTEDIHEIPYKLDRINSNLTVYNGTNIITNQSVLSGYYNETLVYDSKDLNYLFDSLKMKITKKDECGTRYLRIHDYLDFFHLYFLLSDYDGSDEEEIKDWNLLPIECERLSVSKTEEYEQLGYIENGHLIIENVVKYKITSSSKYILIKRKDDSWAFLPLLGLKSCKIKDFDIDSHKTVGV